MWGIVPNGTAPLLDTTPNCSTSVAEAPWLRVSLPVQGILRKLEALGVVDASTINGAHYIGGIAVGPETWGRHWTVVELKERWIVLND